MIYQAHSADRNDSPHRWRRDFANGLAVILVPAAISTAYVISGIDLRLKQYWALDVLA